MEKIELESGLEELTSMVDVGWVLLCTALVFLMQGGFILVREKVTLYLPK